MVKLNWAELPHSATWKHIAGIGLLAGVGFSMSLFITGLAFNDPKMVEDAKYGILLASIVSGTAGVILLKRMASKSRARIES